MPEDKNKKKKINKNPNNVAPTRAQQINANASKPVKKPTSQAGQWYRDSSGRWHPKQGSTVKSRRAAGEENRPK